MAMSAEQKPKFAALHRQLLRLHMIEKFSSGMKNPKQTKNKQTDRRSDGRQVIRKAHLSFKAQMS